MENKTLNLKAAKPFASGGNRLCFVHPDDPARCIKVRRPDFSLKKLRSRKRFPKNLKPLSSFDDNLEEFRVMTQIERRLGEEAFELISRCYGFENSDLGKGLTSELIRDEAGTISHTLKQYLWDNGYTEDCQRAVAAFGQRWVEICIPSRDLILHNVVVQRDVDGTIQRLVVIDGLGNPNILPFWWQPKAIQRKKAERKVQNFKQRIDDLLAQRTDGPLPGYHGQLFHDGTDQTAASGAPK